MASTFSEVEVQEHHKQQRACGSRPKYRDGRRARAVKVYTINLESRYLLVQGVPAIGVAKELIEQFALYGAVEEYNALDEYPAEQFTEVYLIKLQRLQSARVAKRKLDERNFFGGLLHVCYAPEFETVQETREKLQDRRRFVARATSDRARPIPEKKQSVSRCGGPLGSAAQVTGPDSHLQAAYPMVSCVGVSSTRESDVSHSSLYGTKDGRLPRFMSRTAQLQERQMKREHGSALPTHGFIPDKHDIEIGPKLPLFRKDSHLQAADPQTSTGDPDVSWSSYSAHEDLTKIGSESNVHLLPSSSHMEVGLQNSKTHVLSQNRQTPAGGSFPRFMPRTTQLQERHRRREVGNAIPLCGLIPDEQDIVIGPMLPEIKQLDMDDPSLNVSADFIREKLKKVSEPPKTKIPERATEDTETIPPKKQRRRI
ncbi:RNA-binding protein 48 [Spea bombifrons]|uniref:RNA-binding protein 48 n=1 Tax=Spea bombifrons TaxID=233779 RepID=UPI00234A34EC|nr:RNA-binding protein 48 [Spea bombifrons]